MSEAREQRERRLDYMRKYMRVMRMNETTERRERRLKYVRDFWKTARKKMPKSSVSFALQIVSSVIITPKVDVVTRQQLRVMMLELA